jgi:hypothetical protein
MSKGDIMQLADFVNQEIRLAHVAASGKIHRVKLLGVEVGGIWVESQEITNQMLQFIGQATAEQTPIVFLPYHAIASILVSIEGVALDEKAFGV